jgi:hypothetical protein
MTALVGFLIGVPVGSVLTIVATVFLVTRDRRSRLGGFIYGR